MTDNSGLWACVWINDSHEFLTDDQSQRFFGQVNAVTDDGLFAGSGVFGGLQKAFVWHTSWQNAMTLETWLQQNGVADPPDLTEVRDVFHDGSNYHFAVQGRTSAYYVQTDDVEVGQTVEVVPDSLTVFRGNQIDGTLEDVYYSDDSRVRFNPGFTLNSKEAPVWLIFDATLPSDSPMSLEIVIESQAGTPGLTGTLEAWNWTSAAYDVVDISMASFNTDTVVLVNLSSGISDYVQSGSAAVRTRAGWRKTGITLNFPWEVRVDQTIWVVQ